MSAKVVLGLHGEKNQIPSPYARRKGLKKRQLSLIVLNQFCRGKLGPMSIMNLAGKFQIMHCMSCFISSARSSIRDPNHHNMINATHSNLYIILF